MELTHMQSRRMMLNLMSMESEELVWVIRDRLGEHRKKMRELKSRQQRTQPLTHQDQKISNLLKVVKMSSP
jgi:hypothetical protein